MQNLAGSVAEEEFDIDSFAQTKIVVIGSGGAGNNSMTRLMEMGGIRGAETIAINTDRQHLEMSRADRKLLIGYQLTRGLGAGGYPEIGREAAIESKKDLKEIIEGAQLVFLVAGLGGGTGTGSLPILAEIAKNEGAIVIGAVTTPFDLEKARMGKAEEGLVELRKVADTVIVIDNNKLVEHVPDLPLNKAFAVIDELIATMIKGISETITVPSLVNLDFADIRAIMMAGGVAMIGVGQSNTQNRAQEAVYDALTHPLLDVDYKNAKGALVHITGGHDLSLKEVTEIGDLITEEIDPSAQVIWGTRIDPEMGRNIQVMVIMTGVSSPQLLGKFSEEEIKEMESEERPFVKVPVQHAAKKPRLFQDLEIDYVR
jgi:cell division protein FtsZ